MPNDPRARLGLGMLTAIVTDDREGFLAITDEFEGGCPEALATFGRVVQASIRMVASDSGVTPEQVVQNVALRIEAAGFA